MTIALNLNTYVSKLCYDVHEAGYCPDLCRAIGGCVLLPAPAPTVAEAKRRCHRARRIRAQLQCLQSHHFKLQLQQREEVKE